MYNCSDFLALTCVQASVILILVQELCTELFCSFRKDIKAFLLFVDNIILTLVKHIPCSFTNGRAKIFLHDLHFHFSVGCFFYTPLSISLCGAFLAMLKPFALAHPIFCRLEMKQKLPR